MNPAESDGSPSSKTPETLDSLVHELRRRNAQQAFLAKLGHAAISGESLSSLMDSACRGAAQHLDSELTKVLRLLEEGDELEMLAGIGWSDGLIGSARVPSGADSQAGFTLQSSKPIVVQDLNTESRFTGPDLLLDHQVVSGMSVIIGDVCEPWGVIGVHSRHSKTFTDDDVNFLQSVSHLLAAAITRERNEADLAASEERHRMIIDAVPALISYLDEDLVYRYCNTAYTEWFGIPKSEIIGKSMTEVLGENAVSSLREQIDQVLQGQPISFERRVPYRKGGTRDIHAHYIPFQDDKNSVGFYAMVHDVTLQKKREAELASLNGELEQRVVERTREFADLAENVPSLFASVDRDLRYRFVNQKYTETFGRLRSEIIDCTVRDLIGEATYARVLPHLNAALAGKDQKFEEALTLPNGVRIVLRIHFVPQFSDNIVNRILVHAADITAERDLDSAILAAEEREKERIGSDLHDSICQELSGVALLCKTLEKKLHQENHPDEKLARTLCEKVTETTRQARLIASGLVPVSLDDLSLPEAIRQHLAILEKDHTDVVFTLTTSETFATPDSARATQLLLIIREALTNALTHGQANHIEIRLSENATHTQLEIEDNGCGKITCLGDGTGLGLKTMKQRARTLEGTFAILPAAGRSGILIRVLIPLNG